MEPARRVAAMTVVLVSAGLIGCVGSSPSSSTDSSGTTYRVDVVAGQDGDPVANATVVYFTHVADMAEDHWHNPSNDRVYHHEDEFPNGTVDLAASDQFRVLAVETTGSDGRAEVQIDDADALVSVAVGGVHGYTTEVHVTGVGTVWEGAVYVAPSDSGFDDGEPRTVTLYPTPVPVDIQGSLDLASTLPGQDRRIEPYWERTSLELGLWHQFRMSGIDLEMSWNNTPTASADLYLGAGGGDPVYTGSDEDNPPAGGPQTETLAVDGPEGGEVSSVGAVTDTTTVGEELPYRITGVIEFAGADVRLPADTT